MKPTTRQSSERAAFTPLEKTFITGRGWKLKPRPSFLTGFTIIEILTVMSVIIILFGLLVPALQMVKRHAKRVQQKNQFRSIGIALELFNNENEGYPDSEVLPSPGGGNCTTGAHHLAEALMGRDLQGFDPWSSGDAQVDESDNTIYGKGSATPAEIQESLNRRRGPCLKLENVGVFQIFELYGNTTEVYDGSTTSAPVLTDIYRIKKVVLSNGEVVKAGAPILYYRADVHSTIFDYTNPMNSIFNSEDNEDLIALPPIVDKAKQHPFDHKGSYVETGTSKPARQIFYEESMNPQVRPPQIRPYNRDSYILLSAGFDGLYGRTQDGGKSDDVFNFGD